MAQPHIAMPAHSETQPRSHARWIRCACSTKFNVVLVSITASVPWPNDAAWLAHGTKASSAAARSWCYSNRPCHPAPSLVSGRHSGFASAGRSDHDNFRSVSNPKARLRTNLELG